MLLSIGLVATTVAGTAHAETGDGGVHTYRATPGDTASERWDLTANGTDVFVTKLANRSNDRVHYARFASQDATPTLTVTSDQPITSWEIHPQRYYPADAVQVDGNTLTFEMSDQLRYAIVEVNGVEPQIAIVNDPPEDPANVPDPEAPNVVDVSDYVTDLSGQSDQTEQVRAAIDALYSEDAKDTLYFPDGWYQYAGLEIRNQTKPVSIYVDEGALLKNRIQPAQTSMEPAIGIWDSANITVSGRGVFDGNGFANYDWARGGWRADANNSHHQGGSMVVRSSNVVFNDTLVRDAKQWNWETHTAKNVTFNNIKGLTPFRQAWIDGIDLASGQDITVNGALTLGNDDTFASGHYNPSDGFTLANCRSFYPDLTAEQCEALTADNLNWDTEDSYNISVNNTLGWSVRVANGIRIGHSAYGHALKSYEFNNFNSAGFLEGGAGITVQNQPDSGVRTYPRYESITVRNSSFDTSAMQRNFQIFGKQSADPADRISEVTLDNVWFSHDPSELSYLQNITNLKVRDLHIAGEKVTRRTQTRLELSNVVNRDLDFVEDAAPVIEPLDDVTVYDDETVEIAVTASDPDGDEVTLSAEASTLPESASFDAASGVLSWEPDSHDVGTHSLTFVATDAHGASAKASVKIVVEPHITIAEPAPTQVAPDATLEFIVDGSDRHGHPLAYSVSEETPLPEGADFDATTRTFRWTPTAGQIGDHDLVFLAHDEDGRFGLRKVTLVVKDPLVRTIELAPMADTSVQTWNAEQSVNYGDNEHLRLLNFNNSSYGRLGEKYLGGETGRDAKLGYLSFDLSEHEDLLTSSEVLGAELDLTYFGPTKGAVSGSNSLLVARADGDWIEGNGKTTPPARTNTVAGASTWLNKASVNSATVVESSPFDATAPAKVGADATYSANQVPIGTVARTDVLPLLPDLATSTSTSFAVNESKRQDLIFVSREGAQRNPNAAGMGPKLVLTVREQPADVEVAGRCLAGKAYLAVRAHNVSARPLQIAFTTPFGARTFTEVAGGKSAYQSFPSRAAQVPAGLVTVTVEGSPGTYEYDSITCQ
ncbi:putative Ig domain-containing protein [Cellulosimicrobium cellulans]|uniref:putative Ig domain-containing protein n=1 Tax=Cellulosimicrobium cellulans TaxID=1710 RepID=UPI0036EE3A82